MTYLSIHGIALAAYVGAGVLYGANVALQARPHLIRARTLFIIGVAIHTLAIGAMCVQTEQPPFASAFGTLSIAAWIAALLFVPVELMERAPALGALAVPVISLMLFAGILRSRSEVAEDPGLRSVIVSAHVLMVLVSFALLALAACFAAFYIWQYGLLKRPSRRALFRRLPPLERADSAAFHLVAFALPLLTIGLALGIVRAAAGPAPSGWLSDPQTILSVLAWLVYASYLVARQAAGWRGTRVNYLLLAGLIVTLSLFFVPSGTHRAS